jgi:hypothetical protein
LPPGTLLRFTKAVPFGSGIHSARFSAGRQVFRDFGSSSAPYCDIYMAFKRIRSIKPGTEVIALSGSAEEGTAYETIDVRQASIDHIWCSLPDPELYSFERYHSIGFILDTFKGTLEGCVPDDIRIPADGELEKPAYDTSTFSTHLTAQEIEKAKIEMHNEEDQGDRRLRDRFCLKHWLNAGWREDAYAQKFFAAGARPYLISKLEDPGSPKIRYSIEYRLGFEFFGATGVNCPLR